MSWWVGLAVALGACALPQAAPVTVPDPAHTDDDTDALPDDASEESDAPEDPGDAPDTDPGDTPGDTDEPPDAPESDPPDETDGGEQPEDPDDDAPEGPAPPPPARFVLGPEAAACPDPDARNDRAFDPWDPGGAWADQPFDASRPAEFDGGGVAVADIDADGVIDVFRTSATGGFRWFALAPGGAVDRTPELPNVPWSTAGVTVVDADGDGRLDLHVLGWMEPDLLALQTPSGFVAAHLGIDGPAEERTVSSTWGDADGDGDLDVFTAAYGALGATLPDGEAQHVWIRGEDGTFVDLVAALPARHPLRVTHTFLGSWIDLVGDRRPELYVVRDFGYRQPSTVYRVEAGALVDVGPLGLEARGESMGLGLGDLDGDGTWDLVIPEVRTVDVFRGHGGRWFDFADAMGIHADGLRAQLYGWGAEVEDLDADGTPEVLVVFAHLDDALIGVNSRRQPDAVYVEDAGFWNDEARQLGLAQTAVSRGLVVTDVNGDGWLDVVKSDVHGPTRIFTGRCGRSAWLEVDVRQDGPNPFGVGAEIVVEHGGRSWRRLIRAGGTGYGSSGPPSVHVGTGDVAVVDRLEIRWPDGTTDVSTHVSTRRHVRADRRVSSRP
jgi:hypothetical protein